MTNDFKPIKQVIKERIKSLAKDLAWKSLSKEQRKYFMTQAKEKQNKKQHMVIKNEKNKYNYISNY
jgi:TRAP-type C4-dicarboxylate transport system substrate-binding protein